MKHPRLVVSSTALLGLLSGVAGGLTWAAMSGGCDSSGGPCFGYFGWDVSHTTYHAVNGGIAGLLVGLAVGSLIVLARRWLPRHRGVPSS
jgi:hypothetical protein